MPEPTREPTEAPTLIPSPVPTLIPTSPPTANPIPVPTPAPTTTYRITFVLRQRVVVEYTGANASDAFAASDEHLFKRALAEVIDDEYVRNADQVTLVAADAYGLGSRKLSAANLRGEQYAEARLTMEAMVLQVDFELAVVSSDTNVASVQSLITDALLEAFSGTAQTPFEAAVLEIASSESLSSNLVGVKQDESEETLTNAEYSYVIIGAEGVTTIPPTPNPTIVEESEIEIVSEEAVEAIATATAAAVGAAVGASVGASVGGGAAGGAGGGAGGGGGGSGGGGGGGNSAAGGGGGGGSGAGGSSTNPTGDPLTLIFAVQSIAITARVTGLPKACKSFFMSFEIYLLFLHIYECAYAMNLLLTFTDREGFAAGFQMFNLAHMAPPFWAKDLFGEEFANSDCSAVDEMKKNVFYMVFVFVGTVVLHVLLLFGVVGPLMKSLGWKVVPGFLRFPQIEIV